CPTSPSCSSGCCCSCSPGRPGPSPGSAGSRDAWTAPGPHWTPSCSGVRTSWRNWPGTTPARWGRSVRRDCLPRRPRRAPRWPVTGNRPRTPSAGNCASSPRTFRACRRRSGPTSTAPASGWRWPGGSSTTPSATPARSARHGSRGCCTCTGRGRCPATSTSTTASRRRSVPGHPVP
ncbi:MAG: FIG019327: membrane domain, partial [uncultured Blastococcus sp.]